jgi:hypothetical protein
MSETSNDKNIGGGEELCIEEGDIDRLEAPLRLVRGDSSSKVSDETSGASGA